MSHAKRDALGLLGMVALLAIAISVVCSNRQKPLPVSDEAARAVVGEVATATLPDSTGHSASITMYPLTNPQAYEAFAWKPSGPIIKRASESVGDSVAGMVPAVRVMMHGFQYDTPPAHSARETPKELLDPLTPQPYTPSPTEAVAEVQRTAVIASQQGYRIVGGLAAFASFAAYLRANYPYEQMAVFDWLLNGRSTTYARVTWQDGPMLAQRTDLILCGFKSPDAVGVKARHVSNGVSVAVLDMEGTP